MFKNIIRPSQITISLLSKSSAEKKFRITTSGGNIFDLHRKIGAGYRLENVTQGTRQSFQYVTDLRLFVACHA